jgi:hypothetical protein
MPSIQIPKFGELLAANAGADGTLQVASSVPYFVGCTAFLSTTNNLNQAVIITQIVDATHIKARAIANDGSTNANTLSYGVGSNLAAFTTVLGARIDMPAQVARVDQPTYSKPTSI